MSVVEKKYFEILINLSNHSSQNWSEYQKAGFDNIIDLKFPNVDPNWDIDQVKIVANDLIKQISNIVDWRDPQERISLYVAGEFSLSYLIYDLAKDIVHRIIVPTTERIAKEIVKEDGSVQKISEFRFVKWRIVYDNSENDKFLVPIT